MPKRTIILTGLFTVLILSHVMGQPGRHHVRYSVDDGLPQHIVMDIMQDKKGFIWVATWNGLCKFNGYEFTTYLSDPNDDYYMRNNRIDHILEDHYGYIWVQSYDDEAHRFDPETGTFTGIQQVPGFEDFSFKVTTIKLMPSGKVWLVSDKSGCTCVVDSTLKLEVYQSENNRIKSNRVYDVQEDSDGRTWILTDNGLGMIKPGATDPVMFFSEEQHTPRRFRQTFYSMLETDHELWFGSDDGRIWRFARSTGIFTLFDLPAHSGIIQMKALDGLIVIASSHDGLFVYNRDSGETACYNEHHSDLLTNRIHSIDTDHLQNVWISIDRTGVSKLDTRTWRIRHYDTRPEDPNEHFRPEMFILEDSARRIWVHPRGGGFSYYDTAKDILIPLYTRPTTGKFSGSLHAACCDNQGNLWLSSRSQGLEKVIFDDNHFQLTSFDPVQSAAGNEVRAVFEDNRNNLWVSTKDGKLRVFDPGRNFMGYLCRDGTIGTGKNLKGIIYCISQDTDGNIWLGSKGDGLYRLQPAGTRSYNVSNYRNHPNHIYSLSSNNIYAILQDRRGKIWIGTYGGGLNLMEQVSQDSIRFISHRNHLANYPIATASRIRCLGEDHTGKICVGTTVGLIMFDSGFAVPGNISYRYYSHTASTDNSLNNNDIHSICNTCNDMYLATFGGGLNKVATRDEHGFPVTFKAYTRKEGLPSNITLSIVDATDGTFWITTENSLSKFSPGKELFETFGEISRLIGNNIFSEGSFTRLQSGEILFGCSGGILSFFPEQIAKNAYVPPITFSTFRLFNKEVGIGKQSPLCQHIEYTSKVTLTHRQNFFSIEYAALDFRDPGNILYAYKLEGFDGDWIYSQKQRVANYTNLPKGNYIFRVKSTNSDGVWVDNERHLMIEVLPSFWETHWAYAMYGAAFILMLFSGAYILHTIYRLKHRMELEAQLSEMKIRFFTDISHEIRTPLTMITAPVDNLLSDRNTSPEVRKQLDFVARNTRRMLRMVNQVLDLRKIQHLRLKLEEIPLAAFTESVCTGFREIAEKQWIDFRVINEAGNSTVWVDRDCLEKIIFNLLSNAFKYTPAGKAITVYISGDDGFVSVAVKDEGRGITKEQQSQIFNRFTSFNEDRSKPSTGIGLSLVKELADKHHARISVESTPGKGSCFTITFRTGYDHFGKDINLFFPSGAEMGTVPEEPQEEEQHDIRKQASILIVEDDEELREFLRTILETDYKVYEAADGEDGFKKAMEMIPDFIVSDVMMPNKDGVQLLQQIKTTLNTCHIPVVLLTARTAIESKLQGLKHGADDYITKPFSVPYFRARIDNLLQQRKQLQRLYCSDLLSGQNSYSPNQPEIASQDRKMMDQVMQVIEKNMDNNSYSVETLAKDIGVSRTILFKKIKGLTGLTPVEFIRDIKLQRAAQLLSTRQLSVKEVIYMVGMTDAKYFRQCFKKKFGKSPSEYVNVDEHESGC